MNFFKITSATLLIIILIYILSWFIFRYQTPDPSYQSYGYDVPFTHSIIGSSAYWTNQSVADITFMNNPGQKYLKQRDYFFRRGIAVIYSPLERIDMFLKGVKTFRPN